MSDLNLINTEALKAKWKLANLEKMIRKFNKVTKMNHIKLLNLGIHMGKKKYYKHGENDPLLSKTASPDLNTFYDASTEGEVTWPNHELLDVSSLAPV